MSEKWKKAEAFDITPEMPEEEIRKAAVDYAKCHSHWYEVQSRRMGELWNYITFSTIVLSAISSVVSAYNHDPEWRFIPAGLSALATFCAAYLTQFRVRDLWQIRESGRIDAEKLVAKAQLIGTAQNGAPFAEAIALRQELHDLELAQTEQFFVVPKKAKT
ncbi:Protein of unknown function [Rhizobium miluonense]|uniref:SMODS and SLOG-associating 2TM effector domain-containing protein n=2 Tax=Rhizobium miluonense TaxID=411945 RepID=A0A1C3XEH1_9HYPH|nr:Protein of unknown function [Rhizobium miluonense]